MRTLWKREGPSGTGVTAFGSVQNGWAAGCKWARLEG